MNSFDDASLFLFRVNSRNETIHMQWLLVHIIPNTNVGGLEEVLVNNSCTYHGLLATKYYFA